LPRQHRRRLAADADDRGHRLAGQDRQLRADDPPPWAYRDGPHGRGRDRPLAAGHLSPELDTVVSELERLLERTDGPRLVSVTAEVDVGDPSAAVFASRLAADHWFCWEQPD